MIHRTHKGTKIRPANRSPSFVPWVGTETVATIDEDGDGRVALTYDGRPGATITEFASVGAFFVDAKGNERDIWRLPLADWDELVAQVERLRRDAGSA